MAAIPQETGLVGSGQVLTRTPVNVSKVPQRSPFRYPGGKTWFVPWLRLWLNRRLPRPQLLLEPFAGGGIVSLTAVAENLVAKALMVELDEDVAAVWQIVLSESAYALAKRVQTFRFDRETVSSLLSRTPVNTMDRAFHTIVKNRAVHGGILANGSGLMKQGENGKGLASRWYPDTLASRIMAASAYKDRIKVFQADGLAILEAHMPRKTCVSFIDPPYTAGGKRAGTRLYRHNELDHTGLFEIAANLQGDFLMTYDCAPEVAELAFRNGFDIESIPMKGTHHNLTHELIIGRDLSWAR